MLQQDVADDFVLATGKKIKVRTFVEWSFREVGITLEWKGKGIDEKGIDKATGKFWYKLTKNISVRPKLIYYWAMLPRQNEYLDGKQQQVSKNFVKKW